MLFRSESVNGNVVAGPFPKGTLFLKQAGAEDSHGYVRVSMPGRFPGFVHADYVKDIRDGRGVATRTPVSLRYRPLPRDGEAPVDPQRHSVA